MSRIQSLASRPKRTLGALAVVLAAVGITVGSGANFTAQQANAGNAFATGTLKINDPANPNTSAILSMTDMVPGDWKTGDIVIQNTGTLPGDFSLAQSFPTTDGSGNPIAQSGSLKGALQIQILRCTDTTPGAACVAGGSGSSGSTTVFDDTVSNLGTGPIGLGNWAGGAKNRYKFTVTLPAGSGPGTDSLQGLSLTPTYTWNAVSRAGNQR